MMLRKAFKFPIDSWSQIVAGHPVFVLGNGPSLLENDLSALDGCFTIGVNRIYQAYQPTIILWQDASLYRDGWDELLLSPSIKMCREEINRENRFETFELVKGPFRLTGDPTRLYGSGCSGVLAVELSLALGASEIVLLGMDCDYGEDGQTDFYGINNDHTPYTVTGFHAGMRWVRANSTVPVHNCGRAPYWERQKLRSVIDSLNPVRLSRLQWYARLLLESEGIER